MITKEEAKALAQKVFELLPIVQNFKGSQCVVFINADTGNVGNMNKFHSPNGWQGIFFGGCHTLPEIYGRINRFYNPEIL